MPPLIFLLVSCILSGPDRPARPPPRKEKSPCPLYVQETKTLQYTKFSAVPLSLAHHRALSRASIKALHGNGCRRLCLIRPWDRPFQQAAPGGFPHKGCLLPCISRQLSERRNTLRYFFPSAHLLRPIILSFPRKVKQCFVKLLTRKMRKIEYDPLIFPAHKKTGGRLTARRDCFFQLNSFFLLWV